MRYVFTPSGMQRLRERLERTRAAFREVCNDNPEALESGDTSGWHDNFAFEENQRRMHMLTSRVRELERMIELAEVTPELQEMPERAVVGAAVTWRFDDEDTEHTIWLAGFDDGDPARGRVSYNSPIGRVLIGAAPGDLRQVRLSGEERLVEVLALGPTPAAGRSS